MKRDTHFRANRLYLMLYQINDAIIKRIIYVNNNSTRIRSKLTKTNK